MYDRNGLKLSAPERESLNTYYRTAVDLTSRRYSAVAYATAEFKDQWSMFAIGDFKDPRDAAYVAQEFFTQHSKDAVRLIVKDGNWAEVAREFRENIEIPEWQYPAEGLSIEDILGESKCGYKNNYVSDARAALIEVIKVFKLKTPDIKTAKTLINKVEEAYKSGQSYREAARYTMNVKG
jgi:hypothetical protein